MKALKWIIFGPLALLFLLIVIGALLPKDQTDDERARKACADAITSSAGTSTIGYADRKAYNDHVRAKCRGFKIPDLKP